MDGLPPRRRAITHRADVVAAVCAAAGPATQERSPEDERVDYQLAALAQVRRAVRQQGLPCVDYDGTTPAGAWLAAPIVADQTHYHESNHITLERAESL